MSFPGVTTEGNIWGSATPKKHLKKIPLKLIISPKVLVYLGFGTCTAMYGSGQKVRFYVGVLGMMNWRHVSNEQPFELTILFHPVVITTSAFAV